MKPPAGYTARPATPADAAEVAALMHALDSAYLAEPDEMEASEVAGWWARIDLDRDTILLFDRAGRLAAQGMLDDRRSDTIDLDAYVLPQQTGRGLGSHLLAWAESEAERRGLRVVRTAALAADPTARPLIEARGYEPIRHFYRMLIDLDEPPAEPAWPAGFAVAGFAPGEEAILHAVIEDAFADHWGYEPRSLDEWQATMFGQDWWDPSLVYLVREGEEAVAAEVNAFRFGVGWIGTLGVRKPWRGRGLGRALLLAAFAELYRRGHRRMGLAVDAGNTTGATQLYESAGMRVAWQADVYEKRR